MWTPNPPVLPKQSSMLPPGTKYRLGWGGAHLLHLSMSREARAIVLMTTYFILTMPSARVQGTRQSKEGSGSHHGGCSKEVTLSAQSCTSQTATVLIHGYRSIEDAHRRGLHGQVLGLQGPYPLPFSWVQHAAFRLLKARHIWLPTKPDIFGVKQQTAVLIEQ